MPKFTKDDLRQMTDRQLRLIDINSVDDERIIQEVINERVAENPIHIDIHTNTDIRTPEDEAIVQAELDAKREEKRARMLSNVTPESPKSIDDVTTNDEQINAPESTQDNEFEDHVVTQEDLDENPDLAAEGVEVGETIQIPKNVQSEVLTELELGKMKTSELVEYAKSIGLEFGDDITNNPKRVKAILEFQTK